MMANTSADIDLAFQVLSSIFTTLGVIATIAGIHCNDSLAAVLIQRLRHGKLPLLPCLT